MNLRQIFKKVMRGRTQNFKDIIKDRKMTIEYWKKINKINGFVSRLDNKGLCKNCEASYVTCTNNSECMDNGEVFECDYFSKLIEPNKPI